MRRSCGKSGGGDLDFERFAAAYEKRRGGKCDRQVELHRADALSTGRQPLAWAMVVAMAAATSLRISSIPLDAPMPPPQPHIFSNGALRRTRPSRASVTTTSPSKLAAA